VRNGTTAQRPWLNAIHTWRWIIFAAVLLTFPQFMSDPWLQMLVFVGIFVILGLGLNIVVGFAGLLDLGYVAFFAAGAYTMGILASPGSPHSIGLDFWLVLPLGMLVAGSFGILLGLPVLPLRGDYLAIVTLGFGEIIRLFLVNRDHHTRLNSTTPDWRLHHPGFR
jgi:branched-chain amino acid transport system permease protein